MPDPNATILEILARYAGARIAFAGATCDLADLGIDRLDVAMILLDLEDAFDVRLGNDVDALDLTTAADLAALVMARVAALAEARRTFVAPKRSGWMSTGAAR